MGIVGGLALSAVVAFATAIGAAQPGAATSFTIVAGQRFGPIGETTTREELRSLYRGAVADGDVHVGEGLCTTGTKVLPGTPDEIDIAWQDERHARVAFVRTTTAKGRWRTSRGVRIGTTLSELVRLAGRTLTFSGFGWDYGGALTWSEPGGSIGVRLGLTGSDALRELPRANEIYGDREVRSDHPVVQRARITVGEISMTWGGHAGEHDCG